MGKDLLFRGSFCFFRGLFFVRKLQYLPVLKEVSLAQKFKTAHKNKKIQLFACIIKQNSQYRSDKNYGP